MILSEKGESGDRTHPLQYRYMELLLIDLRSVLRRYKSLENELFQYLTVSIRGFEWVQCRFNNTVMEALHHDADFLFTRPRTGRNRRR